MTQSVGVWRMRLLLTFAVIAAAVAMRWALIEADSLQTLRHERDAFRATLNSRAAARIDAQRRECAQVAEQAFHKLGYNENVEGSKTEAFTDHYSRKYDRCLIEILVGDVRGGKQTDMRQIYDVNERQDFGDYYWISSDTKKYWDQKPFQCRIQRPGQDETNCTTTDEWKAYEREMMNS